MANERKSASKPRSVQEACQPARQRRPSTAREARLKAAQDALLARCACGAVQSHTNPVRFVFEAFEADGRERWRWRCAACRQGSLF